MIQSNWVEITTNNLLSGENWGKVIRFVAQNSSLGVRKELKPWQGIDTSIFVYFNGVAEKVTRQVSVQCVVRVKFPTFLSILIHPSDTFQGFRILEGSLQHIKVFPPERYSETVYLASGRFIAI